jgi:hypothetical protein
VTHSTRLAALCALLGLATSAHVGLPLRPSTVEAIAAQEPTLAVGAANQVDVALTVYNGNLALVRDVRQLTLPRGVVHLRFEDISATVNPATVHLRSLSHPGQLPILEQNYEYDLLDPQKLLQKYIGREVTLVRNRMEDGATRAEEVKATLLALNNGPVWRVGDEIVTGMGADHYRFPELPETLYSRPTLVWSLDNEGGTSQKIEAAYLAAKITWSSDYVLTLDRVGSTGDLDGWVTLQNNSGTAFRNAKLQLVAGDLHRVEDNRLESRARDAMQVAAERPAAFAQQAFAEYHLYSLGRRTSINNAETKQLSLLSASGVPVKKRYLVEGQQWYYRNRHHPGSPLKDQVRVYYDFTNDAKSRLGHPMPAGVVRVYQTDSGGQVQYIGEDRIAHTPKDETLTIQIGSAFDVVCERKQTDYQKLGGDLYEFAYEVTLRNRKDGPINVEVHEPIGGDWTMTSSTYPWTKTEAWAARFDVPVPAGGEAKLQYRVRVRW